MSLRDRISRTAALRRVARRRESRFMTIKAVGAATMLVLSIVPIVASSTAGASSTTGTNTSTESTPGVDPGRQSRVTPPGAPTLVEASAGNASVALTWTAPSSNGGSAITGYVITYSHRSRINVGNVTSDTVSALTNGVAYTFSVAAVNAVGTGTSTSSNSVTPGAPTTTTTSTTTTIPTTTTTTTTTTIPATTTTTTTLQTTTTTTTTTTIPETTTTTTTLPTTTTTTTTLPTN